MHESRDPRDPAGFDPEVLESAVIALPLKKRLDEAPDQLHHVVIDLNFNYVEGRDSARQRVLMLINRATSELASADQGSWSNDAPTTQYVYATLYAEVIKEIVKLDRETAPEGSMRHRAIFHVWPDFEIKAFV